MKDTDSKRRVWLGSTPKCDFCQRTGNKLTKFVDGKTIYGPWAMMCVGCHSQLGMGLGTGRGQLYEKVGERFLKIEG